jgi:hypothetical protein
MASIPSTLELAHLANSNGIYRALRQRSVNGAAFEVKALTLKRDAGEFLLKSGTVYLYGEVAGMSTGAVFVGEGTLHVVPPDAMERKQLKAVMKTEVLQMRLPYGLHSPLATPITPMLLLRHSPVASVRMSS